ncbi:hypothetical protein SARC_05933 [Sphaeroforma arctica JP610]|uniref:Uncharacterized protein n=1 Tax=Sphaeroforma arctica JP610 TaxID=667725 RepID=A0A0L0FYQ4_9EUKA|nr:hypothetical protein SARC_05933 [Sphaeroforma arctica JP610]KNC81764.1 hypothetical protein SARC_05933 [Sphaeroforma arctica JP610]|eukprot:XP_014155666.1 hypothetical protein SARC_05933 [Sphaeroforma arctica JP610]
MCEAHREVQLVVKEIFCGGEGVTTRASVPLKDHQLKNWPASTTGVRNDRNEWIKVKDGTSEYKNRLYLSPVTS